MNPGKHRVFVANCTAQVQDFQFVLPGQPRARMIKIEVGRQERLPGELSVAEVEAIVKQHAKYGVLLMGETGLQAGRQVIPIVLSLDKPVPRPVMVGLVRDNRLFLEKRGRKMREEAGVALHNKLNEQAEKSGTPLRLEELEVSIEEVETPATAADDHEQINEVTRVTTHEEPQESTRAPRSRGAATRKKRVRNRAK